MKHENDIQKRQASTNTLNAYDVQTYWSGVIMFPGAQSSEHSSHI